MSAARRWRQDAQATLRYARDAHAERGHLTETAGAIAAAACQAAHAVLAVRGEWITNEKPLLDRGGLDLGRVASSPIPGRAAPAVIAPNCGSGAVGISPVSDGMDFHGVLVLIDAVNDAVGSASREAVAIEGIIERLADAVWARG